MEGEQSRFEYAGDIIRQLRMLVIAVVLVPAIFFGSIVYSSYLELSSLVEERSLRALDILQEHALKVLQTADRLLFESQEALGARRILSPQDEASVSFKLTLIQKSVPEVQSIWIFDVNGRPIVSSTISPVPRDLDNRDRDYFAAQVSGNSSIFVGGIVKAKVGDLTFFTLSRRLNTEEGKFDGVVALTMEPSSLKPFYSNIAASSRLAVGLFKKDGTPLARYPEPPAGLISSRTSENFLDRLKTSPETGAYTVTSGLDGSKRLITYRRIPGHDVYVTASFAHFDFWMELGRSLLKALAMSLVTATLLIGVTIYAVRRTRQLVEEADRRQSAEARLRQGQRLDALGRLTGGVAHDFNNLLMVIQGNIQRVMREPLSPKQLKSISGLQDASERGVQLTRQLLSFSRNQPLSVATIRVGIALSKLGEMIRISLKGDILLELDLDQNLPAIQVDPNELDLAILNLALNARDAMPDGGRLKLEATSEGAYVMIRVSDTGLGIAPDVLPRIFEPFFTTKEPGKGTGLGLSQVYGFVQQSQGKLDVTTRPGEGTTFELRFPVRETVEPPTETISSPTDKKQLSILLVEDNESIAEVTANNLEASGHRVRTVHRADDAIKLSLTEFDAVISDVVMPGKLDGIAFAKLLKKAPQAPAIVLTTGYTRELRTAEDEAIVVLRKPYKIEDLLELVYGEIRAEAEARPRGSRSNTPTETGR